MIILGICLWLVGFLFGIGVLQTLGVVIVVVGVLILLAGYAGHPVGGRGHWW